MTMLDQQINASVGLANLVRSGHTVLRLPEDQELLADHQIKLEPLIRSGYVEHLNLKGLYRIRRIPKRIVSSQLLFVPTLISHHSYYVSWWTALSHHGLAEQMPQTIWVATEVFRPNRSVAGTNFRFVRLAPGKFFGFQPLAVPGGRVLMASKAKAVLDSLEHPEYAGGFGEVVKAIANPRVTVDALIRTAQRQGVSATAQRLGWLIENLRHEDASPLLAMRQNNRVALPLDRHSPSTARRDNRWGLMVNIELRPILEQLAT